VKLAMNRNAEWNRAGTATRLIVNADDFGMSRGITDGIVVAHRYGFLTSTSLMANMPAAEYAVGRALALPGLGVGVHLNICQGTPILSPSRIPTLVDESGRFHPPAVSARKLWTARVSAHEIEKEFRAQIRWIKDRGIVPTHADSHHHMHLYPAAALPFARALAAENIPCIRASACSVWPRNRSLGGPHEGNIVRRLLVQAYRIALQRTVFRRFESPHSRISFESRDRKNLSHLRDRWKSALENLPSGTFELACHPGLFERGFSESDRIHAQREQEMIWLTDRRLGDILDARSIRLITYRDLSANADASAAPIEAEVAAL
jgi:chitin disaccharide deacetylase